MKEKKANDGYLWRISLLLNGKQYLSTKEIKVQILM